MARKAGREWVYVGPEKAEAVNQIKVVLRDSEPPIWRRLLVRNDVSLEELHYALQAAFGWTNSHLHQFEAGERRFAVPSEFGGDDWDTEVENARAVRLSDLRLRP